MAEKQDGIPEGDDEGTVATEAEAPELQDEQQDDEPDPYAQLAEKLGHVPKDKFNGPPEKWKTPEQFILDGKEIQSTTARELKELRGTIDRIGQTNAQILADRIAEERARAVALHDRAVEDGDGQAAWKYQQQAEQLNQRLESVVQPQRPNADPTVIDWAAKRPWFQSDPLAQQLAVNTAQIYANAGKSVSEQLEAAEREVRRTYPQHFAEARQAPGVREPGGRSAAPSNRGKGFNDMPREAQKVAKDMADRGVIPDVGTYARNYWATEGKQ